MTLSRSKSRLVIVRRTLVNADGTFNGDYVTVAELVDHRTRRGNYSHVIINESVPMTEWEAKRIVDFKGRIAYNVSV